MFKWLNLMLGVVLLALIFVWRQWPDDNLHLVACDVGQGDGLLLTYKDQQMLVDAGPDDSILSCIGENLPFWDREIEAAVITHPQADHMTGLIGVLESYQVEQVFMADIVNDIAEFRALKEKLTEENVPVAELLKGDKFRLGKVWLTVLWPESAGEGKEVADPNVFSSVLLGGFGKSSFLLTGDIDAAIEKQLVLSDLPEVEVLKVAHHGSKYSSSLSFLEQVKPKVALISAGEKNRFGHPTTEVLNRLTAVGAKILRTDEMGDIELSSNGQYWMVE